MKKTITKNAYKAKEKLYRQNHSSFQTIREQTKKFEDEKTNSKMY